MKTVKQTLIDARKLLNKGWCQKMFAQNKDGDQVDSNNEDAVKFCMLGAINRAACIDWQADEQAQRYEDAKQCVKDILPNKSFAYDNDAEDTTQEKVIGWFDAAIATCK